MMVRSVINDVDIVNGSEKHIVFGHGWGIGTLTSAITVLWSNKPFRTVGV